MFYYFILFLKNKQKLEHDDIDDFFLFFFKKKFPFHKNKTQTMLAKSKSTPLSSASSLIQTFLKLNWCIYKDVCSAICMILTCIVFVLTFIIIYDTKEMEKAEFYFLFIFFFIINSIFLIAYFYDDWTGLVFNVIFYLVAFCFSLLNELLFSSIAREIKDPKNRTMVIARSYLFILATGFLIYSSILNLNKPSLEYKRSTVAIFFLALFVSSTPMLLLNVLNIFQLNFHQLNN